MSVLIWFWIEDTFWDHLISPVSILKLNKSPLLDETKTSFLSIKILDVLKIKLLEIVFWDKIFLVQAITCWFKSIAVISPTSFVNNNLSSNIEILLDLEGFIKPERDSKLHIFSPSAGLKA